MTSFRFAVNVTPKPGILDPAGPRGRGQPRPPRHRGGPRRPGRAAGRADGRGRRTRRPPGRSSSGWPPSCCRTRSSRSSRSSRSAPRRRPSAAGGGGGLSVPVRIGVVVFPGSNCDRDTVHALELAGAEPVVLWHEQASLEGVAAVVLPGGFAYGDYLRAGVIARFSPVMRSVAGVRRRRRPRPRDLQRLPGPRRGRAGARRAPAQRHRSGSPARRSAIAAERLDTPFTHALDARRPLRMPVAHGEGLLLRRRRDARRARARRAGAVPLRGRRRERRHSRAIRPTRTARCARSPASSTPPATWPA